MAHTSRVRALRMQRDPSVSLQPAQDPSVQPAQEPSERPPPVPSVQPARPVQHRSRSANFRMDLPQDVLSVIASACQSGSKLSYTIKKDGNGTFVQLCWGSFAAAAGVDHVDFSGPAAANNGLTEISAGLANAACIQYKEKDGKPGLGFISSDSNSDWSWLPIAITGEAQKMDFQVHVTVQNKSSVDLSGCCQPLEQGEWTAKLPFPIKSGSVAHGTAKDPSGVRGSPGIKISAPDRKGEFHIMFQCLQVMDNELKLEKGEVEVTGLKAVVSFQPPAGSPLLCNLIIEDAEV